MSIPSGREETIGFGLVGAGMIASYYVKAIAALAATHHVRLVGVLGRSEEKAAAFAQAHQIPFHTADAPSRSATSCQATTSLKSKRR